MQRIIVVGNTASGKSTLAKKLAETFGLFYQDLDDLHFLPGWQARPPEEFRALLDAASRNKAWVLAGNYIENSSDISFQRADTLIWLDLPFLPNFLKLLQRTIKRIWTAELIHNGNRETFLTEFCSPKSIIWWFFKLRKHDNEVLEQLFANPANHPNLRLIRLSSYKESRDFIKKIQQKESSKSVLRSVE